MNDPVRSRAVWRAWLIAADAIVVVFGAAMLVAPGPVRAFFGFLVLSAPDGIARLGAEAGAYITLVHGVLGAVMVGWGVGLMLVILGPYSRGSREAWLTLAVSVGIWFILDTALSLSLGVWRNAFLNVLLLALFAIPLAATRSMLRNGRT